MRSTNFLCRLIAVIVGLAGSMHAAENIRFNRDVRPILSNTCLECHGLDAKKREADLRLDSREGAIAELESGEGRAIVPDKPDESILLARITSHDADQKMPPPDSGKTLTEAQIDILRKWISQGANYERHWAFVAPESAPLPKVKQTAWPRNPIDYFVLARLEKEGLAPSPEADRRMLIRRVAFDVTGLPPTHEEIREFLDDPSPHAYEQMVDRFLASRHYGEHMARQWLDLARYADSNGYQYDTERTMWVWRDWVIDAYNTNMPFDRFTVEQLAGDLLPGATPQQVLATGFNRNHSITIEGGVIDEEYRTEYVLDRLVTSTTVWMGLTMGCARCHDHKFDPISQKEFYQLSAFFNQVPEKGNSGFDPKQNIVSPLAKSDKAETLATLAALREQLAALQRAPDQATVERAAKDIASATAGWDVLDATRMTSSGGSTFVKLPDRSIVVGGGNSQKDTYEIAAHTELTNITAVRLECLTHSSLPAGGPGRNSNSNFVLSEFELVAVSIEDPTKQQPITFARATADYSQQGYHVSKSIDGTVAENSGWAVDGPNRKEPATAVFYAAQPFGFDGGTELVFGLRHESSFEMHGIGRPRLSITQEDPATLTPGGIPADVRKIAAMPPATRKPVETARLQAFVAGQRAAEAEAIQAQIVELSTATATAAKYPPTMVMRDMSQPRETHFLIMGQYDRKGDVVVPGVPASLLPMQHDAPANRLGFAEWLTDPAHPLTARVAVNRYWQRMFGTGLVKTAEDFGTQGEWPSHPELLDALAVTFAKNWDVKAIQRLLLTSATYRQSPRVSKELFDRDPENRLLARGPRFRLDAEQIRDQALAVSGLLVDKVGGPSVYPYQPPGLWMELNNRPGYSKAYEAGKGEDLYRRSIYTFWKRTVLSPMLTTFDAPGREFCTVRRSRTNTPLQALLLLQGPQYVEAARHLAQRMMTEGGQSIEPRIAFGFELATAREPNDKEIAVIARVYRDRLTRFQQDPQAADKMLSVGDSPRDRKLDTAEHAAWTEVARLLLNLDETITKG